MLFRFPVHRSAEVVAELKRREGGFTFEQLEVLRENGEAVAATVPIYRGKNLLREVDMTVIALIASQAAGSSGRCRDYVLNIEAKLKELGVRDEPVELFAAMVRKFV